MIKRVNQAGDTIVEVLIVIAVLGVVIAGGYRVAVASLQATQAAQERSYALKIAEGQLEALKGKAATDPAVLAGSTGFCLENDTKQAFSVSGAPNTNIDEPYTDWPTGHCRINPQDPGNISTDCSGYCYYYGIKPEGGGSNNYTAIVHWDGPRGNRQQVQLSYRIHP